MNFQEDEKALVALMNKEQSYPEPTDPDFQKKIYEKREFTVHRIHDRPVVNDYSDIERIRDDVCGGKIVLREQQAFLSNYLVPGSSSNGILIFHGTGTGKTCAGIAIAEKYKAQVSKYNTKIIVLVPGPLLKESWKREILKCTTSYTVPTDPSVTLTEEQKKRNRNISVNNILQYYKFLSYKSFHKKILGEKVLIKVKDKVSGKLKSSYKKDKEGNVERDISSDRIQNLNDTIILIDEAHNLTGNAYGEALKMIMKNSRNLKIVLLTATPMKNLADDIVELLNFICPSNKQIARDKIFFSHAKDLQLKPNGLEYLKKMASGLVSHVRGADPLTFAIRVEKGEIHPDMKYTKTTRCFMQNNQLETYKNLKETEDDSLGRKAQAISNFVFPYYDKKNNVLTNVSGKEGIANVRSLIKSRGRFLNELIRENNYADEPEDIDFLATTETGITGEIFNVRFLKDYSIKFYKAIKKTNRIVDGKKGSRTFFVYSNLVKAGVELFQEVMINNGYLEYNPNKSAYVISNRTRCYFCGKSYKWHQKDVSTESPILSVGGQDNNYMANTKNSTKNNTKNSTKNTTADTTTKPPSQRNPQRKFKPNTKLDDEYEYEFSDSSSDYEETEIAEHEFGPATFVSVTGKSNEEIQETIPEEKQKILENVFSNVNNIDGKYIKCVLGSKVMNEGISLFYVAEIHILDVHYNLGRVDQIIGRGIRYCSHYSLMSKDYPYPYVNVYKYVTSMKDGMSSDETLYQKAEIKYYLIKQIERALKEVAIDCPLNMNANVFAEEVEAYKNCVDPMKAKEGDLLCPSLCDYKKCNFKCDNQKLNEMYFDEKTNKYSPVPKDNLDFSTFNKENARAEISSIKEFIKFMYRLKNVYTLIEIVEFVKKSYDQTKIELFDEYFCFRAIEDLTPVGINDINNFKDTIYDKLNRPGYLLHAGTYYIFQPFSETEELPMYYRVNPTKSLDSYISIHNYLDKQKISTDLLSPSKTPKNKASAQYDLESAMDYYYSRDEYKYVGYIDKTPNGLEDVFKIREKRSKNLDKKRAEGLPTLKGSVCYNSKEKVYLVKLARDIGAKIDTKSHRLELCKAIMYQLLALEKYATDAKKNKKTYMMVPYDHPLYKFPYNLEDRKDHVVEQITKHHNIDVNVDALTTRNAVLNNIDELGEYFKLSDIIDDKDIVAYLLTFSHPKTSTFENDILKITRYVPIFDEKAKVWSILIN